MTKEEFEELRQRALYATTLQEKIDDLESKIANGASGIVNIHHLFNNPYGMGRTIAGELPPELAAIDQKVFALVRAEYKVLLEKLKAEFAALT